MAVTISDRQLLYNRMVSKVTVIKPVQLEFTKVQATINSTQQHMTNEISRLSIVILCT